MKDIAQIMQQAQAMQAKMAEVQAKIEATEADGVAGAGLVRVKLKGKGELVSVSIDKSLMSDDPEIIEDLIKAAHGDARKRLDQAMEDSMRAATSGMGGLLPGFKLPF
jgi:DNA-binding YbaB/EbfC family protein